MITAIAHPSLNKIKGLAVKEAEGKPKDLDVLRLKTEPSKSKNFIATPESVIDGVFRRHPNAHRRGIMQTRGRELEIEQIRAAPGQVGDERSEHEIVKHGPPSRFWESQ